MIKLQEQQQQEIVEQFSLPKSLLEGRPPMTATEVLLRQKLVEPVVEEMRRIIYKIWIDPMGVHIVRMYWKYEGSRRVDRYILKMIKTM